MKKYKDFENIQSDFEKINRIYSKTVQELIMSPST